MSASYGVSSKISPPALRGRPFVNGNPGRRMGSKNRITAIALALLEGEAEALVRKAIEQALGDDSQMLKFLVARILPRERTVSLDLPKLDFADDVVEATASITRAVAAGIISPSEGAALVAIVNANRAAIDLADVVKRLDELEAQVKGYG
jgi:hypothetical protein